MNRINQIEIAYPETQSGADTARQLEKQLRGYHIPREIARKTGIHAIAEVTDPWLIVICNPETPKSAAVDQSIERFTGAGRYRQILTLLEDGSPEESFPESLRFEKKPDGAVIEREPLAANIVAEDRRTSLKKLNTEKLRLLAPILGVTFDDLMNRRRRTLMRRLIAVGAAALAASLGFLGFAFSRMRIMAGQNEELKTQYTVAEEARDEAAAQRDAARLSYAKTVALHAQSELEKGDTEKALELCLEQKDAIQDVPEIQITLDKALRTLCAGGYVPVTSLESYRTKHPSPDETEAEEKEGMFPEKMDISTPEDLNPRYPEVSAKLSIAVPSYGYALYRAEVKLNEWERGSLDTEYCGYIHFPLNPTNDYYLKDPEGNYISPGYPPERICPLSDGRLAIEFEHRLYIADPAAGTIEKADDGEYQELLNFEGADVFFLTKEHDTEVRDKATLELLDTLEGVTYLKEEKNAGILIGKKGKALAIFNMKPFGPLFEMDDEMTAQHMYENMTFHSATTRDGQRFLELYWRFYDVETGRLICDLDNIKNGWASGQDPPVFTPEGWVLVPVVGPALKIWDLKENRLLYRLNIPSENQSLSTTLDYSLMGPADDVTGTPDASVIAVNDIVFELRESREVPDSTEEQLMMAEELLRE